MEPDERRKFFMDELKAIEELERFRMTREEAERFLAAKTPSERLEIVQAVRERAYQEREKLMPMPITEGPPLPRMFNIRWPWKKTK